jgi:hypothetical protein
LTSFIGSIHGYIIPCNAKTYGTINSYKKLALGIALATSVSGANAAVVQMPINDVFLSVWDATTQTSFSADLGVDLTTFVGQVGSNLTYQLGSTFASWAASGNALTYNIAGTNQISPKNTTVDGVMLSSAYGNPIWITPPVYFTLLTEQTIVKNRVNDINVDGNEIVVGNTAQSYFNSTNFPWGVSQGAAAVDQSTTVGGGGLNQLLVQYVTTTGSATVANNTVMNLQTLSGYFSLNTANSTLNWTSTAVSSVPVPAAVWLFMGGLMSVLGFQKRKSALAA